MPGRLPEGYHRGLHRQDEPRIPRRYRDLRRKGVREGLILKGPLSKHSVTKKSGGVFFLKKKNKKSFFVIHCQ